MTCIDETRGQEVQVTNPRNIRHLKTPSLELVIKPGDGKEGGRKANVRREDERERAVRKKGWMKNLGQRLIKIEWIIDNKRDERGTRKTWLNRNLHQWISDWMGE